jgi:hypothetical protein
VIDTITSKVVLILGRFTDERKRVLDAIRVELRRRDYLPILFDFAKPENKDLTGTVSTLAHLARFIIADLTDPSCIPYELATVVPHTKVPLQAIKARNQTVFNASACTRRFVRCADIEAESAREAIYKGQQKSIRQTKGVVLHLLQHR